MYTPVRAIVIAASFVLAGAACSGGPPLAQPSPTSTPSPTATATATAGQVAACAVGKWTSSEAKGGSMVTGGGGVAVDIAANGTMTMDFASMQPATFSARVGNTDFKGKFTYGGKATGTVRMTAASPSASPSPGLTSQQGTWEPAGPVDWSTLTVTLDLTSPVQGRPLDRLPLKDYLGDKATSTGGVVDVAPILGKGTYTCDSTTLVITPEGNRGLVWTLRKA
jgi:hypothetical protein